TVSTRNELTCGSGRVAGEFVSASACRPATAWRHPAPCGKVRGNLAELRTRPTGNAEKVALAARLRAETTMMVGWMAERLGLMSR
ncbi:MAG: hypothetical protein WCQ21_32450, partial [Verrucomicrobiota bacterium]